eukprot:5255317-Prymnesium_polylepis.1
MSGVTPRVSFVASASGCASATSLSCRTSLRETVETERARREHAHGVWMCVGVRTARCVGVGVGMRSACVRPVRPVRARPTLRLLSASCQPPVYAPGQCAPGHERLVNGGARGHRRRHLAVWKSWLRR